ncbi:MAG TPA: hypothetical protein GX505_12245 [Clostridiales bacterium]|nr:hypothetical protein [Clostridiales bacterium]
MAKLFYLVNLELKRFRWILLSIVVFLIIFQQILLGLSAKDTFHYIPYEEFFASSGSIIVFGLAFASTCALCIWSILSNYHGSKSVYTLMTLPQNRSVLYLSKLIACLMYFIVTITSQMISILMGYVFFAPKIQRVIQESSVYGANIIQEHASNGLFLAFVRSDFFRIIFPLGWKSFISSASLLFSTVTGLVYGILCERSKRYKRIILAILQAGYGIYIVNYRVNANLGFTEFQNLIVHSIFTFVFAAFFIWDSVRLIQKSEIS